MLSIPASRRKHWLLVAATTGRQTRHFRQLYKHVLVQTSSSIAEEGSKESQRAVDEKIGRNGGAQKGKIVLGMTKTVDLPDRIRSLGGAGAIVGTTNTVLLQCLPVFCKPTAGAVVGEARVSTFPFSIDKSFGCKKTWKQITNVGEKDPNQLVDGDIGCSDRCADYGRR